MRGKSGRYQCPKCGNNFSDFTDTPFEYSKIPFGKILHVFVHIGTKRLVNWQKNLNFIKILLEDIMKESVNICLIITDN